jgi:hypothetical protein
LLTFLAEMLHPAVRTNLAEVERLRDFLNIALVHDGYELIQVDAISGAPIFDYRLIGSGVRGSMKNLIFAAVGPKPEIVLDDAVKQRPAHRPQRAVLPGLRPALGRARADLGRADRLVVRPAGPGRHAGTPGSPAWRGRRSLRCRVGLGGSLCPAQQVVISVERDRLVLGTPAQLA